MFRLLYTSSALDRAHLLRQDDSVFGRPDLVVLPFWQALSLTDESPCARFLRHDEACRALNLSEQKVFLGLRGEEPIVAVDLAHTPAVEQAFSGSWSNLREIGAFLPPEDASLLAYGRAILLWHRRARFCGDCGCLTRSHGGGHWRQCESAACGALHYPRTDPTIIVRVENDEHVLLGRQKAWAEGMWSILAGFVEPGETLERAVAREVAEETGVQVTDVSYIASQPWPFPSSLMIAFRARANGGVLVPDQTELEDARWFSRREILRNFSDSHRSTGRGFFLPGNGSVARRLLDDWLHSTR